MKPPKSALSAWLAERPLLAAFGGLVLVMLVVSVAALVVDRRIQRPADALRFTNDSAQRADDAAELAIGDNGGNLLYVPAYSHIYSRGGEANLLEITLSVRNIDPNHPVTLLSVDYFDTGGARIRQFLEQPVRLGPLATTEFLVEERDATGGSGANFIVEWTADERVNPPLAEAVMVGFVRGQYSISFARPAIPLHRTIDE